jgi:hypothetical protein
MKKYPDVSELFALKEARRKAVAKLPIEEKVEISNRLRLIARYAPGLSTAKRLSKELTLETRRHEGARN